MKKVLPAIGAAVVAACTFQNPVGVAPAFDATQPSVAAVAGNYVLVLDPDGARLSRTVRASGLSCPWDTYPVSILSAAPESARNALRQVFDRIEFANAVPSKAEMRRDSIDGVITVRVDRFKTRLDFKGAKATGVATTEFALSATLNGADGRGFATSARSVKSGAARRGSGCAGAREAVGRSIGLAMRDAFEQVGLSVSRFEVSALAALKERGATRRDRAAQDRAVRPRPTAHDAALGDANAERIARDRRIAKKRQVDTEVLTFVPIESSVPIDSGAPSDAGAAR